MTMVELIVFAPIHFPILADWFKSERDVVQWGGPGVAFPLDDDQLQRMLNEGCGERPSRLCWMARSANEYVGHAQLAFDWRNGNARLSRVATAPHLRGRGYAVPMLRLTLARAFEYPEIERVELNVYSWNAPAIQIYKRLGFVIEGSRRSSALVGNERWDTVIMALLRSEWRQGALDGFGSLEP